MLAIDTGPRGSQRMATRRMASMPKPGSIVSIFMANRREMRGVAGGARSADRQALLGAVDAKADKREGAGGETFFLQRAAEGRHPIGQHLPAGLGGGGQIG